MEDRKRPGGPDDSAPPAKRQAVLVNGAKSHQDADLPFKDDIEAFQKDAILRQMKDYKRQTAALEAQLRDLDKRAQYHDDHLRTIDSWFDQLIDEIKILSLDAISAAPADRAIPATLLSGDNETFAKHLADRREAIVSALSDLFARYPTASPQVGDLQEQLAKQLAQQKTHLNELQQAIEEKEQMSGRLDMATHRYMVAEKKLDRLKSAQIQKLERSAIANVVKDEPSAATNGAEAVNGIANGAVNEELETARDEAVAAASKRKEQLEALEAENKKLTEQLTALNVKLTGLSDDDYAKTDLFKTLKSQHEDVIKRINNLEATNIQLREEAQKFQAERTAYRMRVDEENRNSLTETEGNLVTAEANVARIRNHRDQLVAQVAVLESGQRNVDASTRESRELVSACEKRIAALESEAERLRLQLAERDTTEEQTTPVLESMGPEQLRSKVVALEKQCKLLSDELPALETAWKKAQALAAKKVAEVAATEEHIARLNADKAKAEQKYFSAMKAKEALGDQVKILKAQGSKSTEVVAQLKEADTASRTLVDKLEKQSAEMRAQMEDLTVQYRTIQQKVNESAITSEGHVGQIAELKKLLETKDTSYLAAKHAQREAETDKEKMAAQVGGLEKQIEYWKDKNSSNQSDEAAMMQMLLLCQVCKTNFKDTVIKTCGHVFCNTCVQDRLINRQRKCPNCSRAFGNGDIMRVHL
ncbi:E3 ubiquitin-protein ligase-like protein bre1 [Lophiotrema nucula]|uniref:E3 ubiquitin protein ligase n=1 Tax=Lophiotrema nucula TaxID=690887 RepID=A0A6A5Z6F1_9PLEO|nr:E3 ubiquitin-protein ligase-like protein bre1 [Lophiotrema nucula]